MRIGILSGGGDSPAINAAIRAIVRKTLDDGHTAVGIRNGWGGLLEADFMDLGLNEVAGILPRGGTILGTSRTNPWKIEGGPERALEAAKENAIEALIAIGGDDTLGVCHRFNNLPEPLPGIGIPQTIDNDIKGTDYAIGFDTAVAIATSALDKLHTTAESHHRIMILEVMGRDSGHVALEAGVAGGADIILVPEYPIDLDEVAARIEKRRSLGRVFSIVVVAEGAKLAGGEQITRHDEVDAFGHVALGGIGHYLGRAIREKTGFDTRVTVLGHLQRGGIPTAFDRLLATRFGVFAVELVEQEKWDHMTALVCGEIMAVPLEEGLAGTKPVDEHTYKMAKIFY